MCLGEVKARVCHYGSLLLENSMIFPQVLACEYVLICKRKCQVHFSKTQKQQKHTGGFITVGLSAVSALVREVEDKRSTYSTSRFALTYKLSFL